MYINLFLGVYKVYKVNEEIINYKLKMDKPSNCNLKIYIKKDIAIVILEDLEENKGNVITEVIEKLVEHVYNNLLYDYKISKVFWIHKCIEKSVVELENNIYYPKKAGYYNVVMKYKDEKFKSPHWKYLGKTFRSIESFVRRVLKPENETTHNHKINKNHQNISNINGKNSISTKKYTTKQIKNTFELAGYTIFENVNIADNNINILAISHKNILLCTIHDYDGAIKLLENKGVEKQFSKYWNVNGKPRTSPVWKMKNSVNEVIDLLEEVAQGKEITVNNMVIITSGYFINSQKASKEFDEKGIIVAGIGNDHNNFLPEYSSILPNERFNPPSSNYINFIETMVQYFSEF